MKTGSIALKRYVLNITRMTIHNGPGIRTLVLFKGCPLRCLWCSTPESQKQDPEIAVYPDKCIHCDQCIQVCPLGAVGYVNDHICINQSLCNHCGKCTEVCYPEALKILGKFMTVQDLIAEVKKDEIIYKHSHGGVTLSGGEPLLDLEFNKVLLRSFKEENINIGIDTCGHVPISNIEELISYIDFFLWDIKHMDPVKHLELTGVTNELILSNLRFVSERNIPIYIRIPIIPSYNNSEKNIRAICDFVRSLASVIEINIIPLHHMGKARYSSLGRPYPIADIPLISEDALRNLKLIVESYGLKCNITS
ncbi:MAG: glycyl-radical enzyme activating protein [Deltaproteobacteria bacterium]|nr:glycyl-radical enzyme activating protein [Deltaproteobacteria bacterium]